MNIMPDDPKKWIKAYRKLDEKKKYQCLLEILSHEIPADFFDNIDLLGVITDSLEYLKDTKQHEKMIELYDKVHPWKESLEEWFYCDSILIDDYLYCGNIAGIKKHMDSFLTNPVNSIDMFIPIVDKAVYYDYSNLVLDISLSMYDKVKDAKGLVPGTEYEFGSRIYTEKLQSIYSDLKNNITVNEDDIVEYLGKYGYNMKGDTGFVVELLEPGNDKKLNASDYRENKKDFSYALMLKFCRYMLDAKNVNFSTSYDIFYIAYDSFKRKSPGATGSFDGVFELDEEKYNEEISDRLGYISNKRTCGIAASWGMTYVYDFLYQQEYISDKVYNNALKVIDGIKAEIIEGYANNLWEYDFVHVWEKPESIRADDFAAEKKLFRDTFEHQKV